MPFAKAAVRSALVLLPRSKNKFTFDQQLTPGSRGFLFCLDKGIFTCMNHEYEQPTLEGWDEAYVPTPEERLARFVEIANEVVASVRAEAPGRYLQRERERLSRPASTLAESRRARMRRLTRPLGSSAIR